MFFAVEKLLPYFSNILLKSSDMPLLRSLVELSCALATTMPPLENINNNNNNTLGLNDPIINIRQEATRFAIQALLHR